MHARHILIPIHDFSAGGTELIAFRLARHWLDTGRRVSILAGANDGPLRTRVPDGVEVHILSPERPRSAVSRLFLGRQMAPIARAIAPDAIFIPGNFHFMLARGLRVALPAATIVGKVSNPLLSGMAAKAPTAMTRALLARMTWGIDWFAAMSHGLAREVEGQLGHTRVSGLYDPNFEDGETLDFAQRTGLAPEAPIRLLAVGRLEPQKDFALAIKVAAALSASRRQVSLRIVGEGWLRADLEKQVRTEGSGARIELPGFTHDLRQAYLDADMLLITSVYEGGPATAVEAMATGLPIVSTDCSHFLREFVANPEIGTLVAGRRPTDLAAAIAAQAGRTKPRSASVTPLLEKLRAGQTAQAYLDLFDSLAGHGSHIG